MLKLHSEKEIFKVVSDQIGCPTSSISLANICWKIIQKDSLNKKNNMPNILHWRDKGITNWYEIAKDMGEIGFDLKKSHYIHCSKAGHNLKLNLKKKVCQNF